MFSRINNTQAKKQPAANNEEVRKEAQLEENLKSVQPMGNEAANVELMDQMLREANNDNILDISDEIINEPGGGGIKSSIRNGRIIEHEADDLNNSMYLNTSHNIVNDNNIIRNDSMSEISDESNDNIINTSSKPKKKKPSKQDEKKALEIAEDILQEEPEKQPAAEDSGDFAPLSTYAPDEDMVVETGRKKRKKKGKKDAVLPANQVDGLENIDDARWKHEAAKRLKKVELANGGAEEQAQFQAEEMEKLKNWNFQPVKMSDIKKPGKFRKFLSYMSYGMGKLLGTALQVLTLGHFWRAKSAASFVMADKSKWQVKKDYETIPGWGGARFNTDSKQGKDVIADFRRVPTVWSQMTAAKAADTVKKGDKEEEKPLDPVVSIMIDQPKSGSAQTMNGGEMGHTFLGIEYSRKSVISNRYERYKLQYGFYPAGSATNFSGSTNMMLHNTVLPGQLVDDSKHEYDISRRYPAKPEQINAILNASEKYAEGGYSYYDRNCSTFVKEMVVNTAHLATGGDIFKQSEVEFSHFGNIGMFLGAAFENNAKGGVKTTLMDLAKREDQSYQNYGNKRVTMNDMGNYFSSQKKSSSLTKETYVPGETAERMRRMNGEGTGQIGSYKFNDPLKNDDGNVQVGLEKLNDVITKQGESIQLKLEEIFPEEMRESLPLELNMLNNTVASMGNPLWELDVKINRKLDEKNKGKSEENQLKREDIREELFITADDLRIARAELDENIEKVNLLLNNYLKNDARVHQDLLNLISLLNYGINYVDDLYRISSRKGNGSDEITDLREQLYLNKITVRAGGQETKFTPTHYESYIQIYKDPKTAVAKYARLQELRKKKKESGWEEGFINNQKHKAMSTFGMENDDELTYAEARELKKLERLEDLALDFDNSHKYMIEKDSYSQQDIDYAFQMHDKETNGLQTKKEYNRGEQDTNADVRDNFKSASGIYITLFMEKFFKGLKEEWMKDPKDGGVADDNAKDPNIAEFWLDDFLTSRVQKKQQGFLMIVRGLYRSMKAAEPDKKISDKEFIGKLSNIIFQTTVDPLFAATGSNKEIFGGINFSMALDGMADKNNKFTKLVKSMLRVCEMEEKDKTLTVKSSIDK